MTEQVDTTIVPRASTHSGWRRIVRFRKSTMLAMFTVVVFMFAAVFADVLAPSDPSQANVMQALKSPDWIGGEFILGTDQIGRDVVSRLLFGIRTSLIVSATTVAISALVGVTAGIVAGYIGSVVDFLIMRVVDFMMSIPGILIVMVLAFVLGPGLRTTIIALAVIGWVAFARMSRAEVRVVNSQAFILAARAVGANPMRIALLHTLPNVANTLIVLSVIQFSIAIIAEASISFLGFGVQSPNSSLGIMVSDGKAFLGVAWWLPVFPGLAIFVLVMAINLWGEGLQDWLDPVRRRS